MAKQSLSHNLKKGERHTVSIASMAPGGEGVSRELGPPVFVNRVAPGDVVEVELFDVRKDFARATVVNIVQPSDLRAEPACKLFKVCGGCQWQHLSYEAQLQAKTDIVKQALKHLGNADPSLVRPCLGARHTLNYRNKVQFPVRHPRGSKRILAGYFKQDSHELVNVKHCPIQPEPLDYILSVAKEALEHHSLTAYDEARHVGLVRHINMRFSFSSKEALVTLVLNSKAASRSELQAKSFYGDLKKAADEILSRVDEVEGVSVNLNHVAGNRILGEHTFCIAGKEQIEEILKTERSDLPERLQQGIAFRLSPTSFFQVNSEQAVTLFEELVEQCSGIPGLSGVPVVVDAYAGVGTISCFLAPVAARVIAIEEHAAAVDDAVQNVALNRLDNVEVRLGKVEEILPALKEEGVAPDLVVVDPPRKGLSEPVIEALRLLAPARIVYVSCNPTTLARDLRLLEQAGSVAQSSEQKSPLTGYKTKQVQPIDLFPQTYHVESVTILERV